MTCGPARKMIMDACVLIDFIKTERALLELVVKHVGLLYVASPMVNEVNEIDDENELVALGLIIMVPKKSSNTKLPLSKGGRSKFCVS